MRSKVTQTILAETPEETRVFVKMYTKQELYFEKVQQKFKDKGYEQEFVFKLNRVPIFDPPKFLDPQSKYELHTRHRELMQKQLEETDTWIDYQNYK